jgi:hypothetical protein
MQIAIQSKSKTYPEVADAIDTLIQNLEKSAGKKAVKKAVINLYQQDPDEVLQWYLDDQLAGWMQAQVKAFQEPELQKPEEITLTTIKDYVSTRYERYLDYAKYHTSLANLSEQAGDVLHEVMISVLLKDESKLTALYGKKKRDGYRELDYYILRMIKLNCHSLTSPYRYKIRQPLIDGNASVDGMNSHDDVESDVFLSSHDILEEEEDHADDPKDLITLRFQLLRDILSGPEFTENERTIFKWKFFLENNWSEWTGPQSRDSATATFRDVQKRIIAAVDKRRELHRLQVIEQTFSAGKYMDLKITKSEFLLLRQILSDNQSGEQYASEVSARLEKRLFAKLEEMIKFFDITNTF